MPSDSSTRDINPTSSASNDTQTTLSSSQTMSDRQIHDWTWQDAKSLALDRWILPIELASRHKGCGGRIGVLGGSARYTGAPYYAGMAALQAGADLATIFTAQEAALPIKTYSPELMVQTVYCASEFDKVVKEGDLENEYAGVLVQDMVDNVVASMGSLHSLVIGPGLGRCPLVFRAVKMIIKEARQGNLPVILDADALYMLATDPVREPILQGYRRAIMTPNVMEYKRLFDSTSADPSWLDGVVVVRKGSIDVIERVGNPLDVCLDSHGSPQYKCREVGGLKRSGGIGDLLAGTLATLAAWNTIWIKEQSMQSPDTSAAKPIQDDDLLGSCWTACCIVKRATRHAYEQKGRSMTAPDVLAAIGSTFHEMTSLEEDKR
jgi:ATP-dependent NAD(P)H-hydrate dehydratase